MHAEAMSLTKALTRRPAPAPVGVPVVVAPSAWPSARGWPVACMVLTAGYLASLILRHSSAYSVPLDAVLYTAAYVACAICCASRARRSGASAGIWRLFAVAIALYAVGWGTVGFWLAHAPEPPIPSIADIGWLGLYPPAAIAILKIMHRVRTDRTSTAMLLDAAIAGLGTAAVCAWIVVPRLSGAGPTASRLTTITAAAYPCSDLLLLAAVTATLVAARFDVPRTVWLILGAVVLLTCADCVYLTGVAGGTFQWASWVNGLWLVAVVIIALCSGTPFAARTASRPPTWPVQAVPAVATLSSLAILLLQRDGQHEHIVAALCGLTIAGAVIRLSVSYHEAQALADSRQLAHTDDLTGLINRRGFQERGAVALAEAAGSLAVLLVDLDGFKDVNDGLGHPTGDEVLRALGRRLARESKDAVVIARVGGDEFAVMTSDVDGAATGVADRLLAIIRRPFELQGMELRVDASIGIASAPEHGTSLDELLRNADIAMYRAKAGHQGMQRYAGQVEENRGSLRTTAELRRALENDPGQLVVHYQPKIQLLSGRVAGVEALVRWQHPERGLLMPAQFLPLAEKARLMPLLTERVLTPGPGAARAMEGRTARTAGCGEPARRVGHRPGAGRPDRLDAPHDRDHGRASCSSRSPKTS